MEIIQDLEADTEYFIAAQKEKDLAFSLQRQMIKYRIVNEKLDGT